jgi:hypothetical protein
MLRPARPGGVLAQLAGAPAASGAEEGRGAMATGWQRRLDRSSLLKCGPLATNYTWDNPFQITSQPE